MDKSNLLPSLHLSTWCQMELIDTELLGSVHKLAHSLITFVGFSVLRVNRGKWLLSTATVRIFDLCRTSQVTTKHMHGERTAIICCAILTLCQLCVIFQILLGQSRLCTGNSQNLQCLYLFTMHGRVNALQAGTCVPGEWAGRCVDTGDVTRASVGSQLSGVRSQAPPCTLCTGW